MGAICARGKTDLVFIEGTLNAQKYINILENHLLPKMKQLYKQDAYKFMQDHATAYDSNITQSWLSQNLEQFFGKEEWHAKSPDLNAIENLWSILEDKIDRQKVKSKSDLKKSLAKAWNSIKIEELQKLISSMPNRRSEVRASKGGYTKY